MMLYVDLFLVANNNYYHCEVSVSVIMFYSAFVDCLLLFFSVFEFTKEKNITSDRLWEMGPLCISVFLFIYFSQMSIIVVCLQLDLLFKSYQHLPPSGQIMSEKNTCKQCTSLKVNVLSIIQWWRR